MNLIDLNMINIPLSRGSANNSAMERLVLPVLMCFGKRIKRERPETCVTNYELATACKLRLICMD